MRKRLSCLIVPPVCALIAIGLFLPVAVADDLSKLKLPTYRDKDGYGLGVTEYNLTTDADILGGEEPEHTLEFTGLLQAPEGEDVLCFGSTLVAKSVEDARGRGILQRESKRKQNIKFNALIPSMEYKNRRGDPLMLCETELDAVDLDRPGSEVAEMVVIATAVIVKERKTAEIDAEVTGEDYDLGLGSVVRVSSMELDDDSEMSVELKIKHRGNKDIPVIDSVYALDARGKRLGGGRWDGELELFAKGYDVELTFPLRGADVKQFQVVLATDYDIEKVEFTIEDLFDR